jgi:hypothetical protein
VEENMPYCRNCNTLKDFDAFALDSSRKSGRDVRCKKCRAARHHIIRGKCPNKFFLGLGAGPEELPKRLQMMAEQFERYHCRSWVVWRDMVYRWGEWEVPKMTFEEFLTRYPEKVRSVQIV